MHKQSGMVLVIVLIFLFVLMLLGLGALETSQLQLHMSHNLADGVEQLNAAEAGLIEGENALADAAKLACFTTDLSLPVPNVPSCIAHFDHTDVHYVIAVLPERPCLLLHDTLKKQGSYYRITAWVTAAENYATVLQSTYAAPSANGVSCEQRAILPGRLSWQELKSM